ncbi:Trimethylamine:corrinoid methyltransferase [uncultured Eubacterium sp.]|nr:Trimethylamine:corrinoid methyltransferase [uncultured Eubacterium sp.]
MKSNIKLTFLGEEKIKKIMEAVYTVMETVGADIHCPKAVELLQTAGCVVDGIRVKIPRTLVEECIESAPEMVRIYDRRGKETMLLGDRNSYFGSGPTCCNFIDPQTGERRLSRKEDAANTAKVVDALEHMDFAMSLVMIGDQTEKLADLHEVDAMLRNTTKPIATWAFTKKNLERIFEMCEAVAGGAEAFKERPFLIVYSEPTTPLTHTKDAIEKLMTAAEHYVPCVYTPGIIMGAAGPTSVAGCLTIGFAESLTGLVIHQLTAPGAPFIGGVGASPLDMKTMQAPYGTPEGNMLESASNEITRYLGIPGFDLAGATEAKTVDAQAGMEGMFGILISLLGGGNLIHDSGFIDIGLTGSLTHLVACNEMVGIAKRIAEGIDVSDALIGLDTIAEVGPGGNFLSTKHTYQYFKKEHLIADLVERRSYEAWESDGAKDYGMKAAEKVRYILEHHQAEPLAADVVKTIDKIIEEAEAENKEA